jgi:hypothetical protein
MVATDISNDSCSSGSEMTALEAAAVAAGVLLWINQLQQLGCYTLAKCWAERKLRSASSRYVVLQEVDQQTTLLTPAAGLV